MRWAWEGPWEGHWDETPVYSTDLYTCRIMTSTQWVQHSGRRLLDRMYESNASKLDRQRYSSPLFKEGEVFCFRRWYHWKMKLCEASGFHILEVREAAWRAVERMEDLGRERRDAIWAGYEPKTQ